MNSFIDKILEVEKKVSNEIGEFNLFGLFEREDLKDRYDVVLSLDLKKMNKNDLFTIIHSEFRKILSNEQLVKFSRFVYLKPDDPFVLTLNMAMGVEHGSVEIKNSNFNNIPIKHAFLFSSKRKQIPPPN